MQEEYGANEGQRQDEDNEGVAVGNRNPVTGSMANIVGQQRVEYVSNGPYSEDEEGLTLASRESRLCKA